jgi:3,4-dihydroxy 2-butanone 4-phosphate synthase / GTP cyclohydrolase II
MSVCVMESVVEELKAGRMILLTDPSDRENEGDLVMAAQHVTAHSINFMMTEARGIICLAMAEAYFDRLDIPMMVTKNRSLQQTPFGVSFEAASGITTGVSAADRAKTIAVAANPASTSDDIVMPGHVFPLKAQRHGVLQRMGHTEGSVDLMKIAGLREAAVICEIVNADGTMAGPQELREFVQQHNIISCDMQDIVNYRRLQENHMSCSATSTLPTHSHGEFVVKVFENSIDATESVALVKSMDTEKPPLVRLHSACFTGDVLHSQRCDCGAQLDRALYEISQQGGVLIYLHQEGRGIGLANKIKAYALQDQGLDTVEANHQLGFAADCRDYANAAHILKQLGYTSVRLMTNNPRKVKSLTAYGVNVVERVPLEMVSNHYNKKYLRTKRDKLGHYIMQESVK